MDKWRDFIDTWRAMRWPAYIAVVLGFPALLFLSMADLGVAVLGISWGVYIAVLALTVLCSVLYARHRQ